MKKKGIKVIASAAIFVLALVMIIMGAVGMSQRGGASRIATFFIAGSIGTTLSFSSLTAHLRDA